MLPGRLARSLELAQKTKAKIGLCGFDVAIAGNRRRRQIRAPVFQGDDRLLRTTPDTNVLFHARDVAVAWEPGVGLPSQWESPGLTPHTVVGQSSRVGHTAQRHRQSHRSKMTPGDRMLPGRWHGGNPAILAFSIPPPADHPN